MVNTASELLLGSLSVATRRLNKQAMYKFHLFVVSNLRKETSFPAQNSSVILYISFMVNQGYAVSTISSNLSAISFFHKLLAFDDPTNHFIVKKIMSGAQKIHRNVDTRIPITLEILQKLMDTIHHFSSSIYETLLYRSMFSLMFHAFLRIGEVTESQNNIQMNHISTYDNSISIKFEKFKHHSGPPVILSIPEDKSKYCPVKILRSYIKIRGTTPGPLFCNVSMIPIKSSHFTALLAKCIEWNGLQNLNIKPHSFRIGAATKAAMMGYSNVQIQTMGRWKSCAFKKYIRIKSFQVRF